MENKPKTIVKIAVAVIFLSAVSLRIGFIHGYEKGSREAIEFVQADIQNQILPLLKKEATR